MMEDIKKQKFQLMDVMHHFLAGMKATFTQDVHDGLFLIRQSLGGAGYTGWSAIPYEIENYSPNVTFEGDNTVMAQQSTNFLFKQYKKASQGKDRTKLDGVFAYLSEVSDLLTKKCSASTPEHFLNLDLVEEALKVNVAYKLNYI